MQQGHLITVADLDRIEDPAELFKQAGEGVKQHQGAVDRLSAIRTRALAALYAQGHTYRALADQLGLSAPRVGQLITAAGTDTVEAFKAWHAITIQLAAVCATRDTPAGTAAALAILVDSPTFDSDALADLEGLADRIWRLLHGEGDLTHEQAEEIADMAIYLNATLVIWLRGQASRTGESR